MKALERLGEKLAAGDWAGAERLLKRAAKTKGAPPSVFYNLGKVNLEMGRARPAMTWLKKATQADPARAEFWFELGRAAVMAEDLATARDAFAAALERAPGDKDARTNLGRVVLRLGDYAAARESWTPLAGEPEADVALYRIAAELREADVAERRRALLADLPNRAQAIKALTRVSAGAVPLDLRPARKP